MNDITSQFVDLFDGNRSAVGTEEGGCERTTSPEWRACIDLHLEVGDSTAVGVYPLVPLAAPDGYPPTWVTKWGCVDFDEGEEASWTHAVRLQTLLAKFDVTAWIERSRSKGYHVWVFGDTWAPAAMVRRGLLVATAAVGAPTKEINPKSEGTNDPEFLGNYVRLPYPGWLDTDAFSVERRVMIDPDEGCVLLTDFVTQAIAHRGWGKLAVLASKWAPPTPVRRTVSDMSEISDEQLDAALARVGRRTIGVLRDGPHEGRDRSSTLFWCAQMLVRDGNHTYAECVALLKWADMQWGKFHDRHDFEQRITETIDKAWE